MSLQLNTLLEALPMDGAVRIELCDGVPVFRAPPHVQHRIEELLEKQQGGMLATDEARELCRYEELDELVSLVNRIIRNAMHAGDRGDPIVTAA